MQPTPLTRDIFRQGWYHMICDGFLK